MRQLFADLRAFFLRRSFLVEDKLEAVDLALNDLLSYGLAVFHLDRTYVLPDLGFDATLGPEVIDLTFEDAGDPTESINRANRFEKILFLTNGHEEMRGNRVGALARIID